MKRSPSSNPGGGDTSGDLLRLLRRLSDGEVTYLVQRIYLDIARSGEGVDTFLPHDGSSFLLSSRLSARLGRQLLELCVKSSALEGWIQREFSGVSTTETRVEPLGIGLLKAVGQYYVSTSSDPVVARRFLKDILDQADPFVLASSATPMTRHATSSENSPDDSDSLAPDASTEFAPASLPEIEVLQEHEEESDMPSNRWINARIERHIPGQALPLEAAFDLELSVDIRKTFHAVASDKFSAEFPDEVIEIELLVILESDDLDIQIREDRIRVPRSGPSTSNARFTLKPRRNGACLVRAFIFAERNFVQYLKIPLAVGDEIDVPSPESYGRNIDSVTRLNRRSISLTILPAPSGGFDCTVVGQTQATGRLSITLAELESAVRVARNEMMRVVNMTDVKGHPFQDSLCIDPRHRDAAIKLLAIAGYELFRKIFFGPTADAQTNLIGKWLLREGLNGSGEPLKIQIVARNFPVPWAMLYLVNVFDESTVDYKRFLGMRHVIEQIPLQMNLLTPNEKIGSCDEVLPVSLALNADIDKQMKANHVSRQKAYWTEAAKRPMRPLACGWRTGGPDFIRSLSDPNLRDEIIYVFCHAESVGLTNARGPAASWLELAADGSRVTLASLRRSAPEEILLSGNPLVFINACESAELSPEFYDGFVPYFMSKGARGVIGTECKMPALFATNWSTEFFDRLLKGDPLGEVVRNLRLMFYEKYGNPLGLIYAIHCNGDTTVVQAAA